MSYNFDTEFMKGSFPIELPIGTFIYHFTHGEAKPKIFNKKVYVNFSTTCCFVLFHGNKELKHFSVHLDMYNLKDSFDRNLKDLERILNHYEITPASSVQIKLKAMCYQNFYIQDLNQDGKDVLANLPDGLAFNNKKTQDWINTPDDEKDPYFKLFQESEENIGTTFIDINPFDPLSQKLAEDHFNGFVDSTIQLFKSNYKLGCF